MSRRRTPAKAIEIVEAYHNGQFRLAAELIYTQPKDVGRRGFDILHAESAAMLEEISEYVQGPDYHPLGADEREEARLLAAADAKDSQWIDRNGRRYRRQAVALCGGTVVARARNSSALVRVLQKDPKRCHEARVLQKAPVMLYQL